MTIIERPLFGKVNIERCGMVEHEAEEIYSWGFESYATVEVPAEVVYSEGFESGVGGWAAGTGVSSVARDTNSSHTGEAALGFTGTNLSKSEAKRTFSGLTAGASYTVRAFFRHLTWDGTSKAQNLRIGVSGIGYGPIPSFSANAWVEVTYQFTATTTSHDVLLSCEPESIFLYWDDITLTRDAYTEITDDGLDGQWMGGETVNYPLPAAHSGQCYMQYLAEGTSGQFTLNLGLAVEDGLPYTVTLWASYSGAEAAGLVTLSGDPFASPETELPFSMTDYVPVSYTFTASGSTAPLYISWEGEGVYRFDDITVTRDAYSEAGWITHTAPATGVSIRRGGSRQGVGVKTDVGLMTFRLRDAEDPMNGGVFQPGQVVRAVAEGVPIFTGRVVDVASTYPLDKATGRKRTSVVVTVADAVGIHATTPRYGVSIAAPFYETFEARIERLSGSAQAPIEVPVEAAPREVYAF